LPDEMRHLILKLFARRIRNINFDFSKTKTVIIRPKGNGIGDAVVLTAVCLQLKKAIKGIKIGVFSSERNKDIFLNNPVIDKVIGNKFLSYLKNRGKWQVFMDFIPTFTSKNIVCDYILNPECVICFEKNPKRHYTAQNVRNYDFYVKLKNQHLSTALKESPFAKYISFSDIRYILPDIKKEAEAMSSPWHKNKIRILFNPSGFDRNISKNDSLRIIKILTDTYHEKLDILVLNNEQNRILLKTENPHGWRFAPETDLKRMLGLCDSADLIISVDTSVVHIACALNKLLVGVYANCSENIKQFSPLNNGLSEIVVAEEEVTQSKHIKRLSVDKVITAAEKHINKM